MTAQPTRSQAQYRSRALYEARWIFLFLGIGWLLALIWLPFLSLLFALLILFCGYFFRDPQRTPPADPTLLVAPADGRVTAVEVVDVSEEEDFLEKKMLRVAIFLSIFDVHINRAPLEAKVIATHHRGGLYLDARKPESSWLNESLLWILEPTTPMSKISQPDRSLHPHPRIGVKQITGAIARRIVAWKKPGNLLQRGERFGMIRFGSRTELYLPSTATVLVAPGQKVLGGITPIATLL